MSEKRFWLVWNNRGGSPIRRHETRTSAAREAERLARANQDQTFVVLEAVEAVVSSDIQRIVYTHDADEAPL
jgi:hypothetical protein